MAYNPETGEFEGSDPTSVSQRVTGLMSRNNPLMKQARTRGAQASNRRGLLNTSMGAQAGESAALEQAVPIASQEAQQASQDRISRRQTASQERQHSSQMAASFENSYASMVSNIMNNPELPSSARKQYLEHAGHVRDSNLALVEQMYNVELDWATPHGSGGGGEQQAAVNESQEIWSLNQEIKKLQDDLKNERRRNYVQAAYPNRGVHRGGAGGSGAGGGR